MTILDESVALADLDPAPMAIGLPADADTRRSAGYFARATKVLAGGVSSSARAQTTGDRPYPLYIERGQGSRIWDVDGNEFVDFLLSYGSLPLGHADAGVNAAVAQQLTRGTMFGTCNTVEVELAEQICAMVPCAELVRFANSGSEAICGAIRAARGFTGRNKLLKFEGHYHGWVDVLAVSNRPTPEQSGPIESPTSVAHSRGIPSTVVDDVVIAPWNDRAAVVRMFDAHPGEFAAVICEPIVANNACTMPLPGFLDWLRDECTRRGALLVFDEIVTGFRVAAGGAQELFGVVPNLAVYSKAIGGGLPLSAFAGSRDVMTPIAKNTVKHGGTYNGNPVSAAAALATLRRLAEPGTLARMHAVGRTIVAEIERSARDFGVPCVVQGAGGMFQVIFGLDAPATQYRDLRRADDARYARFRQSLLEQGVHANSSGLACWFTSAAHADADAEFAAGAVRVAMRAIA